MDKARSRSISPLSPRFLILSFSSTAMALSEIPEVLRIRQDDDADGNSDSDETSPQPSSSLSNPPSDAVNRFQIYIIVVVVILLALISLAILYVTKRRKQAANAARARALYDLEAHRSQRVLLAGARQHPSQTWGVQMVTWRNGGHPGARRSASETVEGLDERGEAPPPYEPKSGILGSERSSADADGSEGDRPGDVDEQGNKAPKYEEVALERPASVVRASSRRYEDEDHESRPQNTQPGHSMSSSR